MISARDDGAGSRVVAPHLAIVTPNGSPVDPRDDTPSSAKGPVSRITVLIQGCSGKQMAESRV